MDAFNPARAQRRGIPRRHRRTSARISIPGRRAVTLLTHTESIALFKTLGAKMTPELKAPSVTMPFDGFTQEAFAQKMIDEYKAAGVVAARRVSAVVRHERRALLDQERAALRQAGRLPGRRQRAGRSAELGELAGYKAAGHQHRGRRRRSRCSTLDASGRIVPSEYAQVAKAAGLDIITWTLERSGILADGNNGFYYQTIRFSDPARGRPDAGARRARQEASASRGVFSDWAAPVTFYANCMGLR